MKKDLVPSAIVLNNRGVCTPSQENHSDSHFVSGDNHAPLSNYPEIHDSSNYSYDESHFQEYKNIKVEDSVCDLTTSSVKLSQESEMLPVIDDAPTLKSHPDFDSSTTILNRQYLGDALAKTVSGHRITCVKSGMGTGKTTAIKPLLIEYERVFYCCPNKKLAHAMAEDLGLTYYEDYKRETDLIRRGDMGRRIVGTPQMLALLLKHNDKLSFDLLVFDESESASGLVVSEACKNKSEVLDAMKVVIGRSGRSVFMDADLGVKTNALMQSVGVDSSHLLINDFKRWSSTGAVVLEGSSFKTRKQKALAMMEQDIKSGQNIAVATSSKKYAHKVQGVLSKLLPDANIILIDSDSNSPAVSELIENPDKLVNYNVLIYTPAIGSGVSFDIKNHISRVYGVFTNNKKTGGTQDAMQAMARVRHPVANQWVLALDNVGEVYSGLSDVKLPDDIKEIAESNLIESCFFSGVRTESNGVLTELYAQLEHNKIKDKNAFNARFVSSLKREKIKVSELSVDDIPDSALAELAELEVKEETREEIISIKTKSPKISEDDAANIKARLKFRPDEVSQVERESLVRFQFEAKYNICCDEVDDLDFYIELDDAGAVEKCINREIAQADTVFSKRYLKALVSGLGEGEAFKVDVTNKKIAFNLKRKLYAYALDYADGSEYSHKSLKRSSFAQWVDRNRLALALYEVSDIPKNWKEKPALVLNRLLDNMGFDHDFRKTKKDGNQFKAFSNESISELIDQRVRDGNTWTERTAKLMDLFDTADDGLIAESMARVVDVDGLDVDITTHIRGCLFKLPASMHESAIDEYLRISAQERDFSVRQSPVALANLYLLELAEKHGIKRAV